MTRAITTQQLALAKTTSTDVTAATRKALNDLLVLDRDRQRWAKVWRAFYSSELPQLADNAWKHPEQHLETALAVLTKIPALTEIDAASRRFGSASREACEEPRLEFLAAIMIDGFPNARPTNMAGYITSLVMTVMEANEDTAAPGHCDFSRKISAEAVAAGIMDLWAEMGFRPAPRNSWPRVKPPLSGSTRHRLPAIEWRSGEPTRKRC